MAPRFSIFTPSHDPRYLDECLRSIRRQTRDDWEWIVLLNRGAAWTPPPGDARIRVFATNETLGVGEAKRRACAHAAGEYLVELDHDDLLLPGALDGIGRAFAANPSASLVYSHAAATLADGSRDDTRYREGIGWPYNDIEVDGRTLQYPVSFPPTPHNVSYIWYAPNHVRAFRRAAYEEVGGYDGGRDILDDQELMSRLYLWGDFALIDECLYVQRMHAGNTQRDGTLNARIQNETVELYVRTFEPSAAAWARRRGLHRLDLGSPAEKPAGFLAVGREPAAGVDLVAPSPAHIELADGSVGVIRAIDVLQRFGDKIGLIQEIHRLLAPGGVLISRTPSTDGRGAFQDPGHVAFYNQNSFWYYTDERSRRHVPGLDVRFQVSRLTTWFPSPWHQANDIPYVDAFLLKLPDAGRNAGEINI